MAGNAPRRKDPASPDSDQDRALRHLVAAAANFARALHAAGRVAGLPTVRLFVCAHVEAGEAVVRDDVAVALCPTCAALYRARALRLADLRLIFTPASDYAVPAVGSASPNSNRSISRPRG